MLKKIFLGPIEKIVFLIAIIITIIAILAAIYGGSEGLLVVSFLLTILLLFMQKAFLSENWYYTKAFIYERITEVADLLAQKVKGFAFKLLSDKSNKLYWLSSLKVKGKAVFIASDPTKIDKLAIPQEFMIIPGRGLCRHTQNLNVLIGSSQCARPYMMNAIHFRKSDTSHLAIMNNPNQVFEHDKNDVVFELTDGAAYWKEKVFDEYAFLQLSDWPETKMIELNISSLLADAPNKTGHKAILDSMWDVLSLVRKVRRLSRGKPIGIKLSRYYRGCLTDLCIVINNHATAPDFITISEEFGHSFLSHPGNEDKTLDDLFAIASNVLKKHNLNEEIRLIAEGKPETGFDLLKSFALGISAWFLKNKYFDQNEDGKICHTDKFTTRDILLKSCLEFMNLGGYTEIWQIDPNALFKRNSNGNYESLEDLYFKAPKDPFPGLTTSISLN